MKHAAGILFVLDSTPKKVLLVHPTNAAWFGTYGPPKGMMDDDELQSEGAVRETFEEIGIKVSQDSLSDMFTINYDKNGSVYKKVYVYVLHIKKIEELGLTSESLSKNQLQIEEVDHAQFFEEDEARKRAFRRFIPLLDYVFTK